jgi:hypothetical protein
MMQGQPTLGGAAISQVHLPRCNHCLAAALIPFDCAFSAYARRVRGDTQPWTRRMRPRHICRALEWPRRLHHSRSRNITRGSTHPRCRCSRWKCRISTATLPMGSSPCPRPGRFRVFPPGVRSRCQRGSLPRFESLFADICDSPLTYKSSEIVWCEC